MNKQAKLWQGEFGRQYHSRNVSTDRVRFWSKALRCVPLHGAIRSVLEPGAGRGDNLVALRRMLALDCKVYGVEINEVASDELEKRHIPHAKAGFLDAPLDGKYDLVVTSGFLMHIPDEDIEAVLNRIYDASTHYICIAEYYSPVRRQVKYRGNDDALWLDDFAGRLVENHTDLTLIDYGFSYYLDGGRDLTWFLMEKQE